MQKNHCLFFQQKKKVLIFIFFLFFSLFSFAQQKIIVTSNVLTENNVPLAGVSVNVKGSSGGTTTDAEGKFAIQVSKGAILILSFVGYEEKQVKINNEKSAINIQMVSTTLALGEVVVVGYGVQKKVTITGSVASVPITQMRQSSVPNMANSLAGRISGLTSIQSGGSMPGRDDATLLLRGVATSNGSSPLILIDGVPRDNIRTIDANEVGSISVLKDASATAVFGVRGANGVILITTRRGSEGKPQLSVNAVQSYTSFTREPDRLHSLEYMKLRNEASANDNIFPLPFNKIVMDKYANPLIGLDPKDPNYAQKAAVRNFMYPDHDYYRETFAKYVPQTRVNANFIGGTDKVSYFVTASYLHQGGNLKTQPKSELGYDPSDKMDRYNFRANFDYKVSKSLKAFLNIGSYIEQVNSPAGARWYVGQPNAIHGMVIDMIYGLEAQLPISPGPTTIAGFGVAPGQVISPTYLDRTAYEVINRLGYRNEVRSNLISSFGMDWDLGNSFTKGLSMKGMISYDAVSATSLEGTQFQRSYHALVDPVSDSLSFSLWRPNNVLLSLSKSANARYNINMQGSINYNRTFGEKHNITGMVLAQRDNWESVNGEIPFNVVGLSGRVTYGYDNRYLAEVNMGYNGSEQFAPSKRFGFFPAVSAGWVVSNEDFLKGNSTITNLKLRASYGKVGNDQMGGSRFLYQSDISMTGGGYGSLGMGQIINQGLLGNPVISWEVAKKQNYAVDLQMLKELDFSFDYFVEHRSNILISRGTVPIFQGVPLHYLPKVNMGLIDNRGYEISLTYNKSLNKDLYVRVNGNYSYNHNIVKFMDEQIRDDTYASKYLTTGYSIGQAFGYKIDYSNGNGYFNSKEELDSYQKKTTYSFGAPRVGDFKYVDVNGDSIINNKDIVAIGNSNIPGVSYGLTLNLQYKSFEITTFIQGVSKFSSNYSQGVYENTFQGFYINYHKTAWTAERYANDEKITYPALSTVSTTNNQSNDFFIMNRSFIRLKNIELAYTLPKETLKTVGIQKLRIYASAENLITWDHLRMNNIDPENNEAIGYPVTKMINFGINISF